MEGEDDDEEEQMSPNEIKSNSNKSNMDVRDDALEENDELDIEEDAIDILRDFQEKWKEKINSAEVLGNPRNQKWSNFETEEQKKERIKKEEKKFWVDMTTVLVDKKWDKMNVWSALKQALTKYYDLLT